jgi:hypothetical protein
MSIPVICRTATTQDAAASPSVAASAVAVAAVLPPVTAERGTGDLRGIGDEPLAAGGRDTGSGGCEGAGDGVADANDEALWTPSPNRAPRPSAVVSAAHTLPGG